MDKKKKILIGAVLTVVILLAGVMAGFLIANAEKKGSSPQNVENGALTNNERPVYDEKESTESPKNQEAQAQFTPGGSRIPLLCPLFRRNCHHRGHRAVQ